MTISEKDFWETKNTINSSVHSSRQEKYKVIIKLFPKTLL